MALEVEAEVVGQGERLLTRQPRITVNDDGIAKAMKR
jgi:hypothetical protein